MVYNPACEYIDVWCNNGYYPSFAASQRSMALAGFPSIDYAARTIVTHLVDYGSVR